VDTVEQGIIAAPPSLDEFLTTLDRECQLVVVDLLAKENAKEYLELCYAAYDAQEAAARASQTPIPSAGGVATNLRDTAETPVTECGNGDGSSGNAAELRTGSLGAAHGGESGEATQVRDNEATSCVRCEHDDYNGGDVAELQTGLLGVMCGDELEEIIALAGATTPPARGTPTNWGDNTATTSTDHGNYDDSENACKRLRREEAITFSATGETSEQLRNCGLKRMGRLAANTGGDVGDTSHPAGMWDASGDEYQIGDGAELTKHGAAIN
jgi:hypothetical protein